MSEISSKPYFLRAIYKWCIDNNYTPEIVVMVDNQTHVPMQFVQNHKIIFNISLEATSKLQIDNDIISFYARFHGISRNIIIPVSNIISIYASENNQGMEFEVLTKNPILSKVINESKTTLTTFSTTKVMETKKNCITNEKLSTNMKLLNNNLIRERPVLVRIK